jgi:hypothetical protein
MTAGSLSVLNVGLGDIEITFNTFDDVEKARALQMLKDMQRRGYAILMKLPDGTYTRVMEVDERHGRYVVQLPADSPAPGDSVPLPPTRPKRRGRPPNRRVGVPIGAAHAVGVARSAGG